MTWTTPILIAVVALGLALLVALTHGIVDRFSALRIIAKGK